MAVLLEQLAHRYLERPGDLLERRGPHIDTIPLCPRDRLAVQSASHSDIVQA
jgi:hypothetical protein